MTITKNQAIAELARRELIRRGKLPSADTALVDGKPTSLRKMGSRFDAFKMAGIPGVVMTEDRPEDLLPAAGQAIGGGFAPSVGFAAAGETARQGVRAIRGEGFNPMAIGKTAAATAAGEGIFRGGGKLLKPSVNRLMLSIMKPAKKVIRKNPMLGLEAIEAGIYGTKGGMIAKSEKLIRKYEDQASKILKGNVGKINAQRIVETLENLKANAIKGLKPEDANAIQNIHDSFISQLPKKSVIKSIPQVGPLGESISTRLIKEEVPDYLGMNLEGGQALKKAIYSETPESAFFRKTTELPGAGEARRAIASNLRRQIQGAAPEIKPVLRGESMAIEARNALQNRFANESKSMILPKLAGMGAGGVALSGNPLGGAGILLGDRLIDLLRSTPMVTGTAKNLLRLGKVGRPLTIGASEIARRLASGG